MGTMQRIAPIFAVHDLDAAMRHYRRLGFTVRAYAGGGYGFATRDGVEIHLGVVPGDDRRTSSAYLFVDNADDLAAAWRSAGAEVHSPQDTEWASTKAPSSTPTATSSALARPSGRQPRAEPAPALDPAGWPERDPASLLDRRANANRQVRHRVPSPPPPNPSSNNSRTPEWTPA